MSPLLLLDDVSLPPEILSAFQSIQGTYSVLNKMFPVDSLLVIFISVVTIEVGVGFYKFTMWLIRRIPGQG